MVADHGSHEAIGYLRIIPAGFLGWPLLAQLCVRADMRRQGIARALLTQAMWDARWSRLYTSTEADYRAMRAVLQDVGAREIGYVDALNVDGGRELLFRLASAQVTRRACTAGSGMVHMSARPKRR